MDRIDRLEAALDIGAPEVAGLRVDPARRLTGPGMIWEHPGAVIDILAGDDDADRAAGLWLEQARRVLDSIGWTDQHAISRRFHGGVNLALSAPADQLYSAVFAAQTAWHFCAATLAGVPPRDFNVMIDDLKSVTALEENPALTALIAAAKMHHVDILIDDDVVSLGHGKGARTWPVEALPKATDVDWPDLHDIPLALITGTNGKTTTTRLCAAMARAAGHVTGLTSTDMVQVGNDILDRGDYSGPGGARLVLRDPRVDVAFLEVARGGILRRGLATRRARTAVVTNIAKDHLGEYGVMTLHELAEAKFAVARGLAPDGVLVLNGDDPHVVDAAARVTNPIWWFSLNSAIPMITKAKSDGRPCAYITKNALTFFDGQTEALSVPLTDIPITLAGAAKYNVQNALAAVCLSMAMGLAPEAIRAGLISFASGPQDNPGRLNEFTYNGARVFVDFAHNAHSISAVCDALADMPAAHRFLMLSQPGDHSDQDIAEVTTTALQFLPDHIVAAEIPDYLRGRIPNEIPDLIARTAIANGIDPDQVQCTDTPLEGAQRILEQVGPGDLVLLLVLSGRDGIFKILGGA
ncbi:Mur ligase family protein [Rhodobacteraceae bacterium KMM 6894]|nr:Mur ligase family protein [Rhodobacteraceae bacterium KMM 6894]